MLVAGSCFCPLPICVYGVGASIAVLMTAVAAVLTTKAVCLGSVWPPFNVCPSVVSLQLLVME